MTNYEQVIQKTEIAEEDAPLEEIAKMMVCDRECPNDVSDEECKDNLINHHLYPWGCLRCWRNWLNKEV